MSQKQRPRLEKFFSKIKTLLVVSPRTQVNRSPFATRRAVYVQMELELWLKGESD